MGRQTSGQIIRDTYAVVRHLGSGAFGDVYLARHRYMGLQAMKVFPRNDGVDALEEAYLLAKLSHSNIVRMFEANEFEWEGERFGYFSMEYVEGGTLLSVILTDLSLDARIGLAKDILAGLAFAHSQVPPIIHRDISPRRTFSLRNHKIVCVRRSVDFGLAKHVDRQSLVASAAGKYFTWPQRVSQGCIRPLRMSIRRLSCCSSCLPADTRFELPCLPRLLLLKSLPSYVSLDHNQFQMSAIPWILAGTNSSKRP